jgi:outer membrane protein with beta-barrel domain
LKHLNVTQSTWLTAGALALGLLAAPRAASAQMQWTDKGFIGVSGGGEVGSHTLDSSASFPLYDETATVTTTQKVKGGGFFDITGAYRVWGKNLLAGVSFTHTGSKSDVSLTGKIPDPVVFDAPRTVSSTQSGAQHSENVVHIDAIYMLPVANKIDVGLFVGPSIFAVKQDTVTTLTVTEPGPTISAPLSRVSKTSVGFNIGADIQYMVAKQWGVGLLARYAYGSASIPYATKKLTVGGFQIGGGARFRF